MTNREAIEVIKLAQAQVEWEYPMDYATAFDIAISALQEQELKQEVKNSSDLISRQAAIDAVSDLYWMDERLLNFKKEIDATFDKIMALPSAQPQYTELTPEEAASEIASESIVSASYWLNFIIQLKQMGYVVCRKKG